MHAKSPDMFSGCTDKAARKVGIALGLERVTNNAINARGAGVKQNDVLSYISTQ